MIADDRLFDKIQRKKMSLEEIGHRLEKLRAELIKHRKPKVTRQKELVYELDADYTVFVTSDIYELLFDNDVLTAEFDGIPVEIAPGKAKIYLAKTIIQLFS